MSDELPQSDIPDPEGTQAMQELRFTCPDCGHQTGIVPTQFPFKGLIACHDCGTAIRREDMEWVYHRPKWPDSDGMPDDPGARL